MTLIQMFILIAASLHLMVEILLKYFDIRNTLKLRNEQPEETVALMNHEQWIRTSDYTLAKTKLSILEDLFGFVLIVPIVLFLYPWTFRTWSASSQDGVFQCAFISVAFLLSLQIPSLFLEWYKQFRLEDRFGFNKSTVKLWVSDKIKENTLGLIIGVLLFALLIWLFRVLSDLSSYWWFFVFSAFFILQLSLMVLWPKFILPLFNKLTPLGDGKLKSRLFALADRTGFAANTIEVIDGSKRSGHSNAFFTGFGKFRRIVLYDTLINQMEEDEIEAVLAHEIGHYKEAHIPKKLIFSFLTGLFAFYAISKGLQQDWLYEGLGLSENYVGSISVILIALILFISNFTYWFTPVSNIFSRKHEYEADRFAKKAMSNASSLISALQKLYRENLSHPLPHPYLVFFHYSHPTFFDRKKALEEN